MDYFAAGLDVSLETVSICIVDAAGDILLEKKIEAEPAAIIAVLAILMMSVSLGAISSAARPGR